MQEYDFIFAGGGLAALSLAYQLVHSPLRDRSILIVDREAKTRNDRTWCFWTDQPTPFDRIAYRKWNQIHFAGDGFEQDIDLGDYRYKMIRGRDFYEFARQELQAGGNVEFVRGQVEALDDGAACAGADYAQVRVNGRTFAARWIFDSRFDPKEFKRNSAGDHFMQQHFMGWEIETARAVFSPIPTLLDFRTPQKGAMRFFYVLPFSERRALVEYVTTAKDNYTAVMQAYIDRVLKIQDYQVVATEGGVSPMTDHLFSRRAGRRIMNIGTRGGRIKPSTGYAFLRVQQDSAAIVQSLLRTGTPFQVPPDSYRYRFYDSLMLDVMQRNGGEIKSIFTALFKNNPIERVLNFLDEKASSAENLRLIASLPPGLFLQALFYLRFPRKPRFARLISGTVDSGV